MDAKVNSPSQPSLTEELAETWQQLPNKGLFFTLLAAWLLLFQFLGNATFGYIDTASLLYWMKNAYSNEQSDGQDSHGILIPPLVLMLFWWKRKELLALPNRSWWPGLVMLAGALLLHVVGYMVQQPRISIVALFVGIYALMGMAWGPAWLKKSIFPFFLFVFCIPVASFGELITFPLRHMVTRIVAFICDGILGMNVIQEGTQLYNSAHTYRYEVAAACSGMRSLVAIFALSTVYSFMNFDRPWKRLVMILAAFPLAVIGNVLRLMLIVMTAEMAGQEAGNFVHENWFFSLIPYIPAIAGVLMLGHYMREPEPPAVLPSILNTESA
jgi:exosortase